jgi:tetratricopeptide (TPR) repeat protein
MSKFVPRFVVTLLVGVFLLGQGDYQKGVSYYKQKQFDKAASEFEAIVKDHPDYEFGHRMLGLSYLNLKQYNKAITAFRKAVELKKENFVSHDGLARAFFNSGRYQDAVNALRAATPHATTPRDQYRLFQALGSAAFNLQNFSLAAESLAKATSIQRGNAGDLLQLGISYYHLGRKDEAVGVLEQVASLDPQLELAKIYLAKLKSDQAITAIQSGEYQKAADLLRKQVEADPEDQEAWFNLGLAYLFSENLNAAEEAFRRTTRLSPAYSPSYDRLGYIYEKRKQYRRALESYRKAYELDKKAETRESVERVQKRIEQARQSG